MYKYWLIYAPKGIFKGFKAMGFNSTEEIEWFKGHFQDSHVFIAVTTEIKSGTIEGHSKTLKDYYIGFIEELKAEGDTDIPSFEQYKKELKDC